LHKYFYIWKYKAASFKINKYLLETEGVYLGLKLKDCNLTG